MILIVSNALDVTADYFAARLRASSVSFIRLNTENLLDQTFKFSVNRQATGWFQVDGVRYALDTITAVYYRRPVPPRLSDGTPAPVAQWIDSEVRSAWGGLLAMLSHVIWVNHPIAISGAMYKPEQLARAVAVGLTVPDSVITNDRDIAAAFCEKHAWNVIVKPIGHGELLADTPDGDRLVFTNHVGHRDVSCLAHLGDCPTFFQQHLSKQSDLRVTVVGDAIHVVELHSQEHEFSKIDCRRENMRGMRYTVAMLPAELAATLVAYVHSYGLVYGAIDLVLDCSGAYWFLELNPAGQWAWLEQLCHVDISTSLMNALTPGLDHSLAVSSY